MAQRDTRCRLSKSEWSSRRNKMATLPGPDAGSTSPAYATPGQFPARRQSWPVFSYKLRYIGLVEMAISTNPKPTIYRNLYALITQSSCRVSLLQDSPGEGHLSWRRSRPKNQRWRRLTRSCSRPRAVRAVPDAAPRLSHSTRPRPHLWLSVSLKPFHLFEGGESVLLRQNTAGGISCVRLSSLRMLVSLVFFFHVCVIRPIIRQCFWVDVVSTSHWAHDVVATLNQRQWLTWATCMCGEWDSLCYQSKRGGPEVVDERCRLPRRSFGDLISRHLTDYCDQLIIPTNSNWSATKKFKPIPSLSDTSHHPLNGSPDPDSLLSKRKTFVWHLYNAGPLSHQLWQHLKHSENSLHQFDRRRFPTDLILPTFSTETCFT